MVAQVVLVGAETEHLLIELLNRDYVKICDAEQDVRQCLGQNWEMSGDHGQVH